MILLVGDYLVGPKGALLVDLHLVKSSPPHYFALLAGSRLVVVLLRDTHGRDRRTANSSGPRTALGRQQAQLCRSTVNFATSSISVFLVSAKHHGIS
jgi:hypothetical protein